MKFLPLTLLASLLLPLAPVRSASVLASSPSAFLREEAHSPVHWETWSPDTLRRVRAGKKPVYMFIGSFLNQLSRATSTQSFANTATADYLNRHFVCILVDREEEPALAAAAQDYLRSVKQTRGWPVHLWLTPELQPYDGAAYLPPSQEWGSLSFSLVMHRAGDAWKSNPAGCRRRAARAVALMAQTGPPPEPVKDLPAQLRSAAAAWGATFDSAHGGFGKAPKSLEPELLRFLLHESPAGRAQALATLRALLKSPVRDPLDGGFFRQALDDAWRVPYLQKTLLDQARLALAFLDAAALTHDATLGHAARGALDFALQRFRTADGRFASAEDATADPDYYVWTVAQINRVLGHGAGAFEAAYGVKPAGNVPAADDPDGTYRGKNFLYRATPPGGAAAEAALAADRQHLLAVRDRRPAPARDSRATARAYGLMLAALARGGAQLHDAALLAAAAQTFTVVQHELVDAVTGEAHRFPGTGRASPADYAALALGCRTFARAAHRTDAGALADRLLARAGSRYFDAARGIYRAAPATLPNGVFVRAPASDAPPSAEALAILAGAPASQSKLMREALADTLTEGNPAPGDILLALQR